MSLRILLAIDSAADLREGSQFRETLPWLLKADAEIQILVTSPANPDEQHVVRSFCSRTHVSVELIPYRFGVDVLTAIPVRRLLRRFNPDLVHSWGTRARRALGLANFDGKWAHCTNKFDLLEERSIDRRLIRQSDLILVNHDSITQLMVEQGCQRERIVEFMWGSSLTKFESKNDMGNCPRSDYGLAEDLLLIASRVEFFACNRIKDLLWAVDLLQTIRSDFRFLLFGEGEQEWRLRKFAEQCHADQKTLFMPSDESFLRWLPEVDLYWHSFAHEPRPYEVAAALRNGCPVVAPKILEQSAMIVPDQNGVIYDLGQRDQIARLTNRLFNEIETLDQLKENCQACSDDYSIERTATNVLRSYAELVESRSGKLS